MDIRLIFRELGVEGGIAVIVFLFSVAFLYTSRFKECWYRRYIVPAMVAFLSLFMYSEIAKGLLLLSAVFIFLGYQGYGKGKK